MTPGARAALGALVESGVAFVTIGSAGLALLFPSVDEGYALPDVDVLVDGRDAALRLAAWLHARGWAVRCHDRPFDPAWRSDELTGKTYLRAVSGDTRLDVTFECDALDAPAMMAAATAVDGVPVCPLEDLWRGKLRSGAVRARAFAEAHGLTIPPGAWAPLMTPPPANLDPEALASRATDWGLTLRAYPSGVLVPDSIEALERALAWASATGTPVTVQGRRCSSAGQALSESLVLSTEALDRIVALDDDRVTVEAGIRWDRLVPVLLARGRVPPVLTSYLPATVGGTLSTPAFSRGSHAHGLQIEHVASLEVVTGEGRCMHCSETHHPWLFHAALGGFGRFGVIVRATLRLVRAPEHLRVTRASFGDVRSLCARWRDAADDPRTHHVTAFPLAGSPVRWGMVHARVDDGGAGERVAFASYACPPRPEAPARSAQWLHMMVPWAALPTVLTRYASELALRDGDGVQVLPVRKRRNLTASLARLPAVPDGSLVAGVCLVREHAGRDPARLDAETRALHAFVRALGGTSTLGGTLPTDEAGWRAHLGGATDDVLRAMRRADPAGILGALGTRALRSR